MPTNKTKVNKLQQLEQRRNRLGEWDVTVFLARRILQVRGRHRSNEGQIPPVRMNKQADGEIA